MTNKKLFFLKKKEEKINKQEINKIHILLFFVYFLSEVSCNSQSDHS